ncbi:hypothetical protein Prudu_001970 [Prunus dulcis]|uniref:Uncharacterized protein n=1 Tax=Prunus dulcis TaxID=3755 RepID=A0A4Y1QPQ0_PRUDU|nr:hypothetical protein Prudu_001970 [Prunus dulcis]
MEEIGATVVAVYMRHLHDVLKTSKHPSLDLADCKSKEGDRLFLDPLPGHRVVDEEAKNIAHQSNPAVSNAGITIMRFMRDIIMDPSLGFENKYAKGNQEASYPKKPLMKSGMNGQTVFQFIK